MARTRHPRWPVASVLAGGVVLLLAGGGNGDDLLPGDGIELAAHATEESLADRVRTVQRASSTRTSRDQAIRGLPLGKLPPASRRRVEEIVRSVSLYRQLPVISFQSDREVCRYFIDHPEVAVSIWRAMEISEFELKRAGQGRFEATDRDGTTGTIEVLYQTGSETLAVCEGVYRGPLIKSGIQARVVFHLTNEFARGPDGRDHVASRAQMFVSFPSATVETVARLVSPVGNLIIDRNFREIGCFVHLMSTAMERQPGWVEHLTRSLDDVPQARREELLKLTARVYVEARKREVAEALEAGRRG